MSEEELAPIVITAETGADSIWSRGFVMLCASAFLMSVAFYFIIATLPIYISDVLRAGNTAAGSILAAYTLAALVIRPFAGFWVDNRGRKLILLSSYTVFALLFAAYALADTVAALVVIRVLHGIAWGLVGTAAGTIVVDLVPARRRGEAIGIYGLSFTMAMAIGPAIGLRLAEAAGFTTLFVTAAAIALAGLSIALAAPFPPYRRPEPPPRLAWRNLFEKTALPAAFTMMIVTVTYGGLLSFVAIHGRAIGVPHAGVFFVIYAAGIGVARVTAGRVFDRRGPAIVIAGGMGLLMAGFPILALAQNAAGYYAAAAVLGTGMGVLMPTFSAMVNNMVPPERRGAANSTFGTMFDLGIGIGMALTGAIADLLPLADAFLFSSVLGAAALVLFAGWTAGHYRRHILQ